MRDADCFHSPASTDPASLAAAVQAWLNGRSAADIDTLLSDPAHGCFAAVATIARAADSSDDAVRSAGLSALFAGLVEPLNDGFSRAGRAAYARLFTHAVWTVAADTPALCQRLAHFGIADEPALFARYARLRRGSDSLPTTCRRIVVLSRVTIGADILLTSVAMQRLRQRYPAAELVLLGDAKLAGLLSGAATHASPLRVRPLSYRRRGGFGERLASWLSLADAIESEAPDLVVNPDSRLDQLGILPLTRDPAATLLWENTQLDLLRPQSLADLCDAGFAARLGLHADPPCVPQLDFDAATTATAERLTAALAPSATTRWLAVKLDHGGNPAKALPRAGEVVLLRAARAAGWRILIDRGFGADELANSDALLAALGWQHDTIDLDDSGSRDAQGAPLGRALAGLEPGELATATVVRFHGSIAGFAAALTACQRALSYDSVGHHLAAALGLDVVVAFTGYSNPAFPIAWQPRGRGRVQRIDIPTARKDDQAQWQRVADALTAMST